MEGRQIENFPVESKEFSNINLNVKCNNDNCILNIENQKINLRYEDNHIQTIPFNQINDVQLEGNDKNQILLQLRDKNLKIESTSVFDQIYIQEIYEKIKHSILNPNDKLLYFFESINIKESEQLLQLYNYYNQNTELNNVNLEVYTKGIIIKTEYFNQLINYEYITDLNKKIHENEIILDLSLEDNYFIILYFYKGNNNEPIINETINYIQSKLTSTHRSLKDDIINSNNQLTNTQTNININPNYNQIPRKNKSMIVGIILSLILSGLGLAYADRWGQAILIFLSTLIFGFLFIPLGILIYIIGIILTISAISNYNKTEYYQDSSSSVPIIIIVLIVVILILSSFAAFILYLP